MSDLITTAYAKYALQADASFSAAEDTVIGALVTAVSAAIEKHCRRSFNSATHDELYDGGADEILLRFYPVQSVTFVRCNPQSVLEVSNTLTSTNQQASVEVRSDRLALTAVASGVSSTDTSVTFSGNPTIEACAAAVSALGSGWTARSVGSATGDYGLWPSADLYVAPNLGDGTRSLGNLDCRGRYAALRMHVDVLSEYSFDANGTLYHLSGQQWPAGLAGWDESSRPFPGGRGYYRVKYVAGYTTVPEAVQTACAEWVREIYFAWKRDPSLATQVDVGTTSYTFRQLPSMPPAVKGLLAPYVRRSV
jgi:hypothetical protein